MNIELITQLDNPPIERLIENYLSSNYIPTSLSSYKSTIVSLGYYANIFKTEYGNEIKEILSDMEKKRVPVEENKIEIEQGLTQEELFNENTNDSIPTEELDSSGLISKNFFEYNIDNMFHYVRTRNMVSEWNMLKMKESTNNVDWNNYLFQQVIYKNTEYIPLHTISFFPDPDYPWFLFKSPDKDIFDKYAEYSKLFSYGKDYISFIRKCIEKKYFNLVLFSRAEDDGNLSFAEIKKSLLDRFDGYISRNPLMDLPIPENYNNKIGTRSIFQISKTIVTWCKLSGIEILGYKTFLSNFYYLASYDDSKKETLSLYSAMIKVKDIAFVRACMVTNKPIPSDKIELWIDQSFEEISSRLLLRKEFVSVIKRPMENAGIKIVIFDNLYDKIYDCPTIPKFKTIAEQKEWLKAMTDNFVESERVTLGIKPSDTKVKELLTGFEKDVFGSLKSILGKTKDGKTLVESSPLIDVTDTSMYHEDMERLLAEIEKTELSEINSFQQTELNRVSEIFPEEEEEEEKEEFFDDDDGEGGDDTWDEEEDPMLSDDDAKW